MEISWFFLSLRFYVKSKCKICYFNIFRGFGFWLFMNFCSFWKLKMPKLTQFRASEIAKKLLDSSKLISRKIWVIDKTWNFHTVQCEKTVISLEKYLDLGFLALNDSISRNFCKTMVRVNIWNFHTVHTTVWKSHKSTCTLLAKIPWKQHFYLRRS